MNIQQPKRTMLKIEYQIDENKVLGGPDWQPELSIALTADGQVTVTAGERHSSDNTMSRDQFEGRLMVWRSRLSGGTYCLADQDRIEAGVQALRPLLDRVVAGWEILDNRGRLDSDASMASDEIDYQINVFDWCRDDVSAGSALDWVASDPKFSCDELGIKPGMTEDEKAAAAAEMRAIARADDVILMDAEKAVDWLVDWQADSNSDLWRDGCER